jgi:endonuclease/exonuclease/phosphatase family metal-dependent hydrolase
MRKAVLILSFLIYGWCASAQSAGSFKILSYNVRNCRGLDEVTDYKRVARIISRIDADFVAIQELDSVTERSKRTDVLGELARETKMIPTYRASISYQGGKYGIGFLTREKPIKTEAIALPGSEEKRSLLLIEMKKIVICCSHFSLTQVDREKSVGLINELVSKYQKPVFLAGDLNATPDSPEMVRLAENWQILNDQAMPTIPADQPKKCIDFVAAWKSERYKFEVKDSKVENEPVASDHLPVWVKVKVVSN